MNRILVIGSAHFDVIAQPEIADFTTDKVGNVRIEVGGTACNISINLVQLGAQVDFITSIPETALGNALRSAIEKQQVSVINLPQSSADPLGVFSAHLDDSGDLKQAISQMPIENKLFNLSDLDLELSAYSSAVLDCNLSARQISKLCKELYEKKIPIYISSVSEIKSIRAGWETNKLSTLCINKKEACYLLGHIKGGNYSDSTPEKLISELGSLNSANLLITLGADGLIYKSSNSILRLEAPPIEELINHLGLGDALLSAFVISNLLSPSQPENALKAALHVAKEVGSRQTANLGIANNIENILKEIESKGTTDPLTGLNNREGARVNIEKRVKPKSDSLWTLILDIDFFKKVNDQLGHETGDHAIKEVASIFKASLRLQDIASRWGGEEFVGFLTNVADKDEAMLVAERIRNNIEKATILADRTLTVSIGMTQKDPSETMESALARADQALYKSKQNGRNQVTVI